MLRNRDFRYPAGCVSSLRFEATWTLALRSAGVSPNATAQISETTIVKTSTRQSTGSLSVMGKLAGFNASRSGAVQYAKISPADGLEGGRQATRELLSSGFQPTAILCVNDFMAVGVLRHLRDQGIRVPEDVSVTGFDNIKLAEFCSPALTTVHIPRERIGQTIFGNLVPDQASDRLSGQEILIDPELVVRESTGVARQTQALENRQPSNSGLQPRC